MNQNTIKIGVIGAGGIFKGRHFPALKQIEGVEVVAVCNRTKEKVETTARELNISRAVTDWRDIIAMDDLDAVIIATPPYLHCEATIAALDANKHVFCQARMAMNVEEASRMYKRSLESDRVTMLCPADPGDNAGDAKMKELVDAGFVGKPYNIVVTSMNSAYADPDKPLHWRQMDEISGLNTLDVGMYAEKIHSWFGHCKSVAAVAKHFITHRKVEGSSQMRKVDRPDSVAVVGEMENGALIEYHFSGMSRPAEKVEVYGSDGTLIYDLSNCQIFGAKSDQEELSEIPIPEEGLRKVEVDFIAAIRDGEPVWPSFYDGLKYMEFTEAVFRAADEKKTISLPLEGY